MEISQWDQHYYGNSKTWQQWTATTQLYSRVSFIGEFSPNFDLKNMISTYRKDFSLVKNGPKIHQFTNSKQFQIARVLFDNFQKVAQEILEGFKNK